MKFFSPYIIAYGMNNVIYLSSFVLPSREEFLSKSEISPMNNIKMDIMHFLKTEHFYIMITTWKQNVIFRGRIFIGVSSFCVWGHHSYYYDCYVESGSLQ